MKCEECANMRWFGDYALNYCTKIGIVVTKDTECKLEDEVTEECES